MESEHTHTHRVPVAFHIPLRTHQSTGTQNPPGESHHLWLLLLSSKPATFPELLGNTAWCPPGASPAGRGAGIPRSLGRTQSWKRRWVSSAMAAAMAREEVAAGEGAFLTCRILLPTAPVPPSNTKSSTRLPSLSRAWALTPEGPLKKQGGAQPAAGKCCE